MTALKKLIQARWFPTLTKPIVTGIAASAAIVGLRALGITDVIPEEVNQAVAPLVGFLAAAIAQKAGTTPAATVQVQATVATHTATYKPGETLGQTVAQVFTDSIAQEIDADPSLLQGVAAQALERVLHPVQQIPGVAAATVQEVVSTGNEATHTS